MHGHGTHSPRFDESLVQLLPSTNVFLAVLDIGGLVAITEQSAFEDQEFCKFRVFVKEPKEGFYCCDNLLQRIVASGYSGIKVLAESPHRAVGRRQEQIPLAGKIPVQRSFSDADAISELLGVGSGVATLCK